jgi:Protein of unknown function (DUF3558)
MPHFGRLTLALALSAATLAACGGDDERESAAPGTPANPLAAVADPTEAGATTEPSAETRGAPGYQELVSAQTSAPQERFTPCNLVTAHDARAILGTPVDAPFEAPQGPTCIYRTQDGRSLVTVAIQRASFRQIKPAIRGRRTLAVAGRDAFCGIHGQAMLYVPLGGGRVLSIAAQCGVARDFAHEALRHL